MARKKSKLARKNRRLPDRSRTVIPGGVSVLTTGAGAPTTTKVMNFSGSVMLTGQATGITCSVAGPYTFTQLSPTQIGIAAPTSLAAATYAIPDLDPAIRTPGGGFVKATNGTF